ncbi:GNAT family N-acetyltransferase [Candidatus Pelagibacter sp.]|nr:GNAT family N-acetyltransferase [Candidatus Pelagibacter sp.]
MQEKIYLRPLCLNDVSEKYLSWVNDSSVTEYLEIGKERLSHNDLVRYVEDSPKKGRHNYAIITKKTQQHIGNSSIYSIEIDKSKFEIGYFIGEKFFWGGHYSSMLIFNLLKIGFIKMGLTKCTGYINESHIKGRMTNKFSGYKEIKKINRYSKKINKNISVIEFEITKKDWLKNAEILCSQYPELYEA